MIGAILFALVLPAQEGDLERIEFFEKKIRPILVDRCYACHSAESRNVKGGLLLDSREALIRGGATGPAVVPGDPDRSPLIRAIRYTDAEVQMPPKARLTVEQIADFEKWVRMGVPDPRLNASPAPTKPAIDFVQARKFWSFAPPAAAPPPAVADKAWPRNGLDRFILAKLEREGRRPFPDADRRTLLRRATFDLTGLPPTPEEIDAFLTDPSPGAFAAVVDRLLASPPYGERWGRHWLDLVRYADTAGDSADYPIPQAHRYRDYVVRSFNQDKPYGRFIQEQVAGDLMSFDTEEERREGIIATGFLAIARRFGEEPRADHHLTLDDTIDTLGRAVLGLTLSCARCHDHKFDPIPAEDYYALYGIFQSARFPYAGSEKMRYQKDFVPLVPREKLIEVLKPFEEQFAVLEAAVAAAEKQNPKAAGEAKKKRDAFAKRRPEIDDAYAVTEGTASNARIHVKGNPGHLGDEVPRRFLQLFGGEPLAGRLELARALTDPSHPLTARVIVNRLWQHHFGRGIVETPSYFGRQGTAPTHPELLDHLATEFEKSGGSIKAMHRLVMTSRAYGQVRAHPQRLDAEAIRDALLAVGGGLDRSVGGPHPFPARATWDFSKATPFMAVYPTDRRSLYLMQQRLKKHPILALFDGADTNASTAGRAVSTTALQSLFMMNSPFVREQASRFASRLQAAGAEDPSRVDLAHRLAFGRPATAEEQARAKAFLAAGHGWESLARALLSANEFIYVD